MVKYTLIKSVDLTTEWEHTFNTTSDSMAIDYARHVLLSDGSRWINTQWQLWQVEPQRLVATLGVTATVSVVQ